MASNTDGPSRYTPRERDLRPMATGWTVFAAVLMFFGGSMAVLQGITAIAKDDLVVVSRNYAYVFNLTAWGWIHLVLGALIAIAGLALFTNATWARFVGIAVTGLDMVANFLWLPYYPFWAILLIFINVAVIWALCAGITRPGGREY